MGKGWRMGLPLSLLGEKQRKRSLTPFFREAVVSHRSNGSIHAEEWLSHDTVSVNFYMFMILLEECSDCYAN